MKTAFKILPAEIPLRSQQLMIEIGWEGVSFVYFSPAPFQVNGLSVYQFDKNITAIDLAEELFAFLQVEQLPAFEKVHVCYNFRECLLVPSPLFKENLLAEMLNLVYPVNNRATNFSEPVDDMNLVIAYRVDNRVESVLQKQFPVSEAHHSLALQLRSLKADGDILYCNIYQHSIRVVLFKEQELQIAQFYDYSTPTDVAYHLLNLCSQHGVAPAEVTLMLSGFIDKKSNLYDELFRYFINIKLSEKNSQNEIAQAITQYPEHFFSHLITLAQCVS